MAAALVGFDDCVTDVRLEAFTRFVDARREKAIRIAWRLTAGTGTGDHALAEDAAQDAFCEAYRALDRFRGEASLETWFYRILVRRTRYLVRRQRALDHWIRFFGKGSSPQTSPAPVEPELRDRIGSAVAKLSARQREVFVLMYLEGFSTARVAVLLERSEGTVKSHLHRALKRLRHELRDLAPLNDGAKS